MSANSCQRIVVSKQTNFQPDYKTESMLIGSRQRTSTFNSEPALAINNIPVKRVSHSY